MRTRPTDDPIPGTDGGRATARTPRSLRTWRTPRLAALAALAAVGLASAACGGSSGASSTTSTSAPTGGGSTTPSTLPGASGTIASVSGTTLQVQNASTGQTAVIYTSSTTIRQVTVASPSAVTVGSCISAFGSPPTTTSASGAAFGGPITASTVSVNQPVNGVCTRPGPGGRPRGTPGAGTRRAGGFRGRAFGAATGEVTAVNGSTVTVHETNPRTQATSTGTVTLTGSTTFTTTRNVDPSVIAVGQCARAVGTAGATGAITATTLTVSAPVNGACTTGFGRRGGFGGGGPGAVGGATPGA